MTTHRKADSILNAVHIGKNKDSLISLLDNLLNFSGGKEILDVEIKHDEPAV
ncbi:MAG: hypothetical protein ACRYE9_05985 [Janthinobacterium lividum]